jgi:hypothetical protein
MTQAFPKPKFEEWQLRQYGLILARAVHSPCQMFDIMAANRPMSREQFDAEYDFDWDDHVYVPRVPLVEEMHEFSGYE